MSFIASSFSSSFVSIRRVHLAGSLTIRAFQGSADSSIGSRTKLQGTSSSSRSFYLCRCPSLSMRTRWTILGEFQPPDVFPLASYIFFSFLLFFSLFSFFSPFFTKTERAALENRIDTACKNNAKMSGDASPGKQGRPRPCKIACSIHGRALIRGEFSLSFTAARKQRQHDFHE